MTVESYYPVARNNFCPYADHCTQAKEIGFYRIHTDNGDPLSSVIHFDDYYRCRSFIPKLTEHWRSVRDESLVVTDEELHDFRNKSSKRWSPLYAMQQWILACQYHANLPSEHWPNVVCPGTVFRSLLGLPTVFTKSEADVNTTNYYIRSNSQRFIACRNDGLIYLAHGSDASDGHSEDERILRHRKFEQLVTTMTDGQRFDDQSANKSDIVFSVLERTVGETRVLYSHKVDCEDPIMPDVPAPDRYVKLAFRNPLSTGRFKCWKASADSRLNWLESFTQGASRLLVGYVTKDGIVRRCEPVLAADIPDRIPCPRNSTHYFHFDKVQHINFLSSFFKFLRNIVQKDYTSAAYGLAFDCTNTEMLGLTVSEWTSESEEFATNNIINSWYRDDPQEEMSL